MDRRQRADLDRYITGNYGEDQFRDDDGMDGLWRCLQCGIVTTPEDRLNAKFRWCPPVWQHHHRWPVGHCNMEQLPDRRRDSGRRAFLYRMNREILRAQEMFSLTDDDVRNIWEAMVAPHRKGGD